MTSWHSYPSVFALGHRAIEQLFDDPVIVQEKIDGSQFSFGIFNGELKARSKGKELIIDAPEKMFSIAIETIISLKDKLIDGWTYRGEYLAKPNHNTLKYNRVPKNNIIIFDINTNEESYMKYDDVIFECDRIGLECVHTFGEMEIKTIDTVSVLLEQESALGGTKIEGLVFKNYHKFGKDKKVLMGKYVSEAFKEIHNVEWKKKNPTNKDIIELLITELKTDARREKAVQHLKEKGELENSPKDIGKLLKEMNDDIKKECTDYIKDRLYKAHIDHILRGVIAGMPEWYKTKLAKSQFDEVIE